MNKAMKLFCILVPLIGVSCLLMVVWMGMDAQSAPVVKIVPQRVPMSIIETQQLLIELGFEDTIYGKLTPDNKWGKITEQAMCDYKASQEFKK